MPSAAKPTASPQPHHQPAPPPRNPPPTLSPHPPAPPAANFRSGHWTESEKLRYLMFIEYHSEKLKERQSRRLWKIFKHMAAFVGSRRPNQCRSHHKKMEAYFQTVPKIVAFYRQRYPHYEELFRDTQVELQAVNFGIDIKGTEEEIEAVQDSEIEEKEHENNQQLQILGPTLGNATSIVLENDAEGNEPKDLPKTDETIPAVQQEQRQERIVRPSFIFPAAGEEYASYPYQMPNMHLPHFSPMNANNFFKFYEGQARTQGEGEEWRECHEIFLQWQSKLSQLMGHPPK